MKDLRTLLVLAIVFVALVGVFFLQDQAINQSATPVPSPEPTAMLRRVFPDLQLTRIQAIRMFFPDTEREFVIARSGDGTWSAPGTDGTLDQEAAGLIGGTMVLLPYRRVFSIEDNTNLAQYGFDPSGDLWLQFITTDGEEHIVAIGNPAQDETPTFYALVDDRKEIYLIERAPVDFLVRYFISPPVTPAAN